MESVRKGAALLLVLILAGLARFYQLGFEGLWSDEGYTAQIVALPIEEIVSQLVRFDDAPPLFYLLEKLSVALGGRSEAVLRLVPALAGWACIAVLWATGSHERKWSAVLMATSGYAIFHSRQARSYSLLILLALVLVLAVCDILVHGRRSWFRFVVSSSLLGLTHHVGVIMVASSLLLWPLGSDRRPALPRWLAAHVPALLLYGLLWFVAGPQLENHQELNAWTARYWEHQSLWLGPAYSLASFLPLGLPASQLSVPLATSSSVSIVWTAASLLLGMACLAFAFAPTSIRRWADPVRLEETDESRRTELLRVETGFVVLPLALLLAASLVLTPIFVLGRTDALAFPAFLLLLGRGTARLRPSVARTAVAVWAFMSFISLGPSYGFGTSEWTKGQDRDLAGQIIDAGLEAEDWIIHTFMTSPSLEYYLERKGSEHVAVWFPDVAGLNTASVFPTPADSLDAYARSAMNLRRLMQESAQPKSSDFSVWILGLVVPPAADVVRRARDTGSIQVQDVAYPGSVLVRALVGDQSVQPMMFYRQDWVAGERVVIRIPYRHWAPEDRVEGIRMQVVEE